MRATYAILVALALAAPAMAADYLVPKDGTIEIKCLCVLGTSGCQLSILDSKERKDWTQTARVNAGMRLDPVDMCYRKRDVNGQGDGLCCNPVPVNDANKARLFLGTVTKGP